MAGTAPQETHWLFVEAPGSWGRDALATSSLPAHDRAALAALDQRWRVVLVRRADRPLRTMRDRHVWVSTPEGVWSWLLPLDAAVHPEALDAGQDAPDEMLFVCTNGGRDACCALSGRPLVDALRSDRVWECSHLGGHRFSSTAVRLSDRMVFGRLARRDAELVLAGLTPADHVRGPAGWPPAVQVAAVAVWRLHGAIPIAQATVSSGRVHLLLQDGSRWHTTITAEPVQPRRLSCGAEEAAGTAVVAGPPTREG